MNTMDNVTVKVTIEVLKRENNWDSNTIARAVIEDTSSCTMDELAEKIDNVVGDAVSRAQMQLNNTRRIKNIEQQNLMLASPQVKEKDE